jgi:hypothetical protein
LFDSTTPPDNESPGSSQEEHQKTKAKRACLPWMERK